MTRGSLAKYSLNPHGRLKKERELLSLEYLLYPHCDLELTQPWCLCSTHLPAFQKSQ